MLRRAPWFLALALWAGAAHAQTDPLYRAVDAYALYQGDVGVLLDATSGEVGPALELAARHDPARVSRGWIAYGALTAAQSPAFARGVQSRVRAAGRAPVLRQLRRDWGYARRRPPGSGEAIQLILAAIAADSARLQIASVHFRRIGDALVLTPVAGAPDGRDARAARLRGLAGETRSLPPQLVRRLHVGALAGAPLSDADALGGRRFWDALFGRSSMAPPLRTLTEPRGSVAAVDRMLTLAALLIVDASGEETARVEAALDDPRSRECLTLELLQLRQCASVARAANEDAYCISRHGLERPAACFSALIAG